MATLIPILYCLVIYVPVWLAGVGLFDGSYLGKVLPLLPIAMVHSLATALGEEIGWRGFLAPTLYRTRGFLWAGIGTGLIWALWHLPLIVVGGYDAGTPVWYATTCFLISVPAMSVMLAWLRLRSVRVRPGRRVGAHRHLFLEQARRVVARQRSRRSRLTSQMKGDAISWIVAAQT